MRLRREGRRLPSESRQATAGNMFPVEFDTLAWESPVPGLRFKAFRSDGKQLRLMEFTSDFVEADWCERGHMGMVLSGEIEIDFKGRPVRYVEGSGLFIPAGPANAHKARVITSLVKLFLVEDV